MAYRDVTDLAGFLAETGRRGLRQAVLAWRSEYGQHPTPGQVRYERLHLVTLLAYDAADGCIVRAELDGADRAAVRRALDAAGLAVEERSRNTVRRRARIPHFPAWTPQGFPRIFRPPPPTR